MTTTDAILQSLTLLWPEALLVLGACVVFLGGTFRASRNLWGGAALVTLAAALAGLILSCPICHVRPTPPERIDELIGRLSIAKEKSAAEEELEKVGLPALAPLRKAHAESRELATKGQLHSLIEKIERQASPTIFASVLRVDSLTLFIKYLALAAGALLVLLGWKEIPDPQAAECFACLLVIVAGLCVVGEANDLITLFLALEMISIPSYVLLYLPRFDNASQEASMKYFLLSVFSSALLLFGFSYVYGLTGTTNLPAIANGLSLAKAGELPLVALVALVMVVAGLGFKIAAVPFHFYAPDVYQGTATLNAALLAVVPKAAGFIALIRVLAFVPVEAVSSQGTGVIDIGVRQPGLILGADGLTLLWILAAVTMTLGNVLALLQDNLKRMLAYSSVAHAGYMLIGLAVAAAPQVGRTQDVNGIEAVLFYLVAYTFMTLGVFGVIVYLSTPKRPIVNVDDLAGLSRSHPGVAVMTALFLFSLIGIPFTAGFMGKFFVFMGALQVPTQGESGSVDQARLFSILALIGALNAAFAAWYYLRVVTVMYLRNPIRPLENRRVVPGLVGLVACAIMTLGFGVAPRLLLMPVQRVVPTSVTPTPPVLPPSAFGER